MIIVLILGTIISLLSLEFLYKGIKTQDYFLIYEGIVNFIFAVFCIIIANYF